MAISSVQSLLLSNIQREISSTSNSEISDLTFELMKEIVLEAENTSEKISSLTQANNNVPLDTLPIISKEMTKSYKYKSISLVKNEELNEINANIKNENIGGSKEIYDKDNISKSEIEMIVKKYADEFDIDTDLIMAIIKQESNFNNNVESHAGAKGLMQLMDFNLEPYGVSDPFNPEENIKGGITLFNDYLNMFDNNIEMALMAYNGGPGTMERRGVTSQADLYKMPEETQNYVVKVMNYYKNKSF